MPDLENEPLTIAQNIQNAIDKLRHVLTGKRKEGEKAETILDAAKEDIDQALAILRPEIK